MEREKIIITKNRMIINHIDGNVWLSAYEIAKTFEVFPAKITANIRSILKSGVFWVDDVCFCHYYTDGGSVDLYNLEMITALAFRINSPKADCFRKWLIKQALREEKKVAPTVVFYNATNMINV